MQTPANDAGPPRLHIDPDDLRRYAAGRMEPARRREVEGFLACNPDLAAQVMTELHRGARRPARRRGRPFVVAAAALAMGACAASAFAGWTAAGRQELDGWREIDGDAPPEYVEDAAESRQATRVRAEMASQVESARLDVDEIRRTLRIELPRLPANWRIVDVQVYPTDQGPGVNLTVEPPEGQRLTLFIVRAGTLRNDRPELATRGREAAVFWERGSSAYVLGGDAPRDRLLSEALALANGHHL